MFTTFQEYNERDPVKAVSKVRSSGPVIEKCIKQSKAPIKTFAASGERLKWLDEGSKFNVFAASGEF